MKASPILGALFAVFLCFAAKGDAVEFVERNFGVAATNLLFGAALEDFPGTHGRTNTIYPALRETGPKNAGAEMEWYYTTYSEDYQKLHPRWDLKFGFRHGRLAAVNLMITPQMGEKWSGQTKWLREVYKEARKLGGRGSGEIDLRDSHVQVRSISFCTAADPMIAAIQLTPPEKRARGAGK